MNDALEDALRPADLLHFAHVEVLSGLEILANLGAFRFGRHIMWIQRRRHRSRRVRDFVKACRQFVRPNDAW